PRKTDQDPAPAQNARPAGPGDPPAKDSPGRSNPSSAENDPPPKNALQPSLPPSAGVNHISTKREILHTLLRRGRQVRDDGQVAVSPLRRGGRRLSWLR